jgi:hypothetical protein
MAVTSNTCEGTDTTAVSTSNSGGPDQFDTAVVSGSGNTLTYSATHSHLGSTAILCSVGSTAGTAYFGWNTTTLGASSTATHYARFYFYCTSFPANGVARRLFSFFDAVGGGTLTMAVQLSKASNNTTLRTVASNGTTVLTTGTTHLSLNTWYRVDISVTPSTTTGSVDCRLFAGADLESAVGSFTEQLAVSGSAALTAVIGEARFGLPTSLATFNAYIDDVAATTDGFIGPAGTNATATPTAIAATTSVPTPSVTLSTNVTPTAIAATSSLPTPSVDKISATAIGASTSILVPKLPITSVTAVPGSTSIPTPTVSESVVITSVSISATSALFAPSIPTGVSIFPISIIPMTAVYLPAWGTSLSSVHYGGSASDLGGGSGVWVNVTLATGSNDDQYAVWAVP